MMVVCRGSDTSKTNLAPLFPFSYAFGSMHTLQDRIKVARYLMGTSSGDATSHTAPDYIAAIQVGCLVLFNWRLVNFTPPSLYRRGLSGPAQLLQRQGVPGRVHGGCLEVGPRL